MSRLISYRKEASSIFQLLGDRENDITLSVLWALSKCPIFTNAVVKVKFNIDINPDDKMVSNQNYDEGYGIRDGVRMGFITHSIIKEMKRPLL